MGAGVVRRREPKRHAGVRGGRYARRRRRSYRAQGLENRVHSFGGGEERPSVALLVAVGIAKLGAQRLHRGRTLERVRAQRVEERARRGLGSRRRHTTAVEGGANARGGCRVANARGVGFLGCANRAIESTAVRRLFRLASSASSASSAPAARTRSAGALLSPRQKRKKATTRACSKVHLTSSNRRS